MLSPLIVSSTNTESYREHFPSRTALSVRLILWLDQSSSWVGLRKVTFRYLDRLLYYCRIRGSSGTLSAFLFLMALILTGTIP